MVDRSDIDRITTASREAVKSATNALEIFLEAAEGWPPEEVRDGLLELIPDLVNEYGDVAASAAADWYEQVRGTEVAGSYRAVLAEPVPREQVEGTVRAAARHLFTGDVAVTQRILEGALQRYITSQTRNTTVHNTLRDPQAKRFARVPKGKTCSFCMIMASRGFVYATAKAAGELSQYHDKCDCQIVPAFGNTIPRIEGYDPDALLREYEAARNAAAKEKANPTISAIAQKLREIGGDKYTDGHSRKSIWEIRPSGVRVPWGLTLQPHELATADRLAESGMTVSMLPIDNTPGVKNPDAEVDGEVWEFKAPMGGSKNTISDQFKKAGRQAPRLVLDLRRSRLDDREALAQIERRFFGRHTIHALIVIDHGGAIHRYSQYDL